MHLYEAFSISESSLKYNVTGKVKDFKRISRKLHDNRKTHRIAAVKKQIII